MVQGFLRGGLVGAVVLAIVLMLIQLASRDGLDAGDAVFCALSALFVGGGIGGTIGATRASAPSRRWIFTARPSKSFADEARAAGPDLRTRLWIAALYALALASLGTVLVVGMLGRYEVARLVNGALPYGVGTVQARVMVAGTIFVCAFALAAALSLQVTRVGLADAERRLLAAAGFVSGVFALPALGVVLG